jgi:hypothetical protein
MQALEPFGADAPLETGGGARSGAALVWRTTLVSPFGLAVGPISMTILAIGAFIAPLGRRSAGVSRRPAFGASIISLEPTHIGRALHASLLRPFSWPSTR